jgi:hypothetical protein
MEAKTAEELAELAERAINGDLSLGSQHVKVEVLQRAARVHVEPKGIFYHRSKAARSSS